jgi:hypothetical protein
MKPAGPKEQALRDLGRGKAPAPGWGKPVPRPGPMMADGNFTGSISGPTMTADLRTGRVAIEPATPAQPAPIPPEEKKPVTAKSARIKKTKREPDVRRKVDRSPLAVGTFIVGYGRYGAPMADIEKQFGMDAHPLRAKIHAARHKLGFDIEFDREKGTYVGKPPRAVAEPA